MAELVDTVIARYRAQWAFEGCPVPLAVSRSRYDDITVSWEVMWHDSLWNGRTGCASPIAEFTTWREAQDWAQAEASMSGNYRIGRDRIVGPMPMPWGYVENA